MRPNTRLHVHGCLSICGLLLLGAGCVASSEASFKRQSGVLEALNGVAYLAPGVTQVAMSDNLCEMNTLTGLFGTDAPYAGGDVRIEDSDKDADGKDVIVISTGVGVYVKTKRTRLLIDEDPFDIGLDPELFDTAPIFYATGPVDGARITPTEVMILQANADRCGVLSLTSKRTHTLPPGFCDGGATLESSGERLFVGGAQGVMMLTPTGPDRLISDQPAQLLAYDPLTDTLTVGALGGHALNALSLSGETRWSLHTEGAFTAISALGDRAELLVASRFSDGQAELLRLNGATGERREQIQLFNAVVELNTSADGEEFAITRDGGTDFFSARPAPLGDFSWIDADLTSY